MSGGGCSQRHLENAQPALHPRPIAHRPPRHRVEVQPAPARPGRNQRVGGRAREAAQARRVVPATERAKQRGLLRALAGDACAAGGATACSPEPDALVGPVGNDEDCATWVCRS